MNSTPEQTASSSAASPVSGLAIVSLVLGILAVGFSFLLLGGILGLVGLILGAVCLGRKQSRTAMVWFGFSLSLLGLLASFGFGVLYHQVFRHFRAAMESDGSGLNKDAQFLSSELSRVASAPAGGIAGNTMATFQQQVLAFNKRTLTEAYQRVGVRDPKWDDLVIQYLDDHAQRFTDPQKAPPAESLLAAGKRILELGCTDPLVVYCHGVTQKSCNDTTGAERSFAAAAEQLPQSKYPAVRQQFAVTRMAYVCRDYGFRKQSAYEAWRTQAIALMAKSLTDGSYGAGDQRVFMLHFERDWDDLFLDKREEVHQAIKAVKGLDPWIAQVVEGDYWIAQAWKARGSGWANTVTNAGWKGFYAGLAKARTNLTAAWKQHPDYPEAASRMITVAKGESGQQEESARAWFDRAIQSQFDYLPAYNQYRQQLLPRWGGSHETMLDFGLQCMATKRFDTSVPYQYYVMVRAVVNDRESPGTTLWDDPSIFTNLQTMCEGYLQSEHTPSKKTAYQTLYAAICWRTGHYDAARRILDDLGDQVEAPIFMREFDTPFDTARTDVYALTSTFADDLKNAGSFAASNLQTKAVDCYQNVLERANGDSNVVGYASRNIEALALTIKASGGDWVPLVVPKDLTGWSARAGVWKVEQDGAVVGESTRDGLLLVCNQPFTRNMEVKGDLEFVRAPYLFKFNGGLAVGSTDQRPNEFYSSLLYEAEHEVSAGMGQGFRGSDRLTKPAVVKSKSSLLMRTRDNRLTVVVNGTPVFDEVAMEGYETAQQQRIGIGGYYWYPGAVVRFRNLQVRSLKNETH